MENNQKFNSGVAIPPGETLQEVLDDLGMSQKELAERMGITPKHINKIIKGTAAISYDISIKLENVLGINASFWNNLEMKYQETKARIASISNIDEEIEILNLIPYTEISNLGWVEKTKDSVEKIINLRKFFGVASLNNLPASHQVAFRKSSKFEANSYALATWLTKVEDLATNIETVSYDKSNLEKAIPAFKKLTKLPAKAAIPKLQKLCSDVGIALVIQPHLCQTYLNGVTKWLSNDKIMIALSPKGGYEDIFWFTFFHELGHVFQEKKSQVFIDGEEYVNDALEIDADNFALNNLIPINQYNNFVENKFHLDIVRLRTFAEEMDINIGILVGRLMKDKHVDFGNKSYERLRRKLKL